MSFDPERFHPERVAAALADPARLAVLDRTGLMSSEPEQAFDRWAALAARALRAPIALITLFDDRRQYLKSVIGLEGAEPIRTAPAQLSICQYVISGASPLAVDDARDHPQLADHVGVVEHGIVAYAGTPITVHGQPVGSLCVTQQEPRGWTAADLALLGDFSDAIAGEIALRLAAGALGRANALVAAHNRIHELISADAPLREILDEVVLSIEGYDPRLRGSVLLLDAVLRTVHHGAAPTLPPEYLAKLEGLVIGPEVGSCGSAAFHGVEVVSADLETDPRWAPFRELAREHGLRHCWSFPILGAGGDVLGTFGLYGSAPREPTEEHRRFIRDAAHLAGIAIQRQRATDELVHRATHDPLTGLPNRTLLFDRLTHALARGRRSGTSLAVLFIDLDRLKLVNDTLGHEVGDAVLREVAERISGCVRPGDTVARFGGDEFIAVCEGIDPDGATVIADRIIEAVMAAKRGAAGGMSPTASVGIAVVPGGEVDAHEAIRRADEAMYAAKEEGGNRHRHGPGQAAEGAGRRLEVEAALRGALDRGEFHLVAQPVARFLDGSTHGVEALLRWTHPELGEVGPDEFVPIAEETGLIDAIGAWVLRESCAAIADVHRATGTALALGVNVSPRQLRHPAFAAGVQASLSDSGLRPERLVVEITETALLGSDPATAHTLAELRALGVQLVLDDFGTGFSSLSMLKERPIDGIKIDRSFVAGLPADTSSGAIVAAVVGMAHALGRTVTAEGIETSEQLAFLRALGCDLAQGYLLGRPMPFAELEAWLTTPAVGKS
ncbi:MAG TPA: EAL domain-containing protein [Baekduia sp.]|uniref:putative bifunctional diguanylate cyclase/phosphodiesterase n=1 Tax=Baekduia sp. TaxID=2600305 RepID=UPI002BE856F8|nr:EAL domain-containing protein [Baekduia sp.]HMJ33762.1 EAL domain-containing protein [Baekduia sp.]